MKFTPQDFLALLPFLVTLCGAILVILVDAFHDTEQRRTYVANLATTGMFMTLMSVVYVANSVPPGPAFGGMIFHDHFSSFLNGIFALSGMLTIMLSPRYLSEHRSERGEYYSLIMLAVTGMMLMAAAGDLLMIFLGIEVMSVSVYVLVGFFRSEKRSTEASMKYFFLGAFASAILLYGIALIYGTTGATNLRDIGNAISLSVQHQDNILVQATYGEDAYAGTQLDPLFLIGVLMLLVGMGFKIALAPFHMWTPDAYEGAPSTSAGFMATAVKAAGFGALIRILILALGSPFTSTHAFGWVPVLFTLAAITIVVGNLIALTQTSVKRMLAYSSVAHAGYALIGVVSAGYNLDGGLGNASVLFYLLTYTFATLGAFGVLAYLSRRGREVESYDDLAGLAYRYPWLGVGMTIFMLSSAGLPPTAGFIGKFYVFKTAVMAGSAHDNNSFIVLVVVAVLASLAGAFYYLRVIVMMYMKTPEREPLTAPEQGFAARLALIVCAAGTLILGVFPGSLPIIGGGGAIGWSEKAMTTFSKDLRGNSPKKRAALPPADALPSAERLEHAPTPSDTAHDATALSHAPPPSLR